MLGNRQQNHQARRRTFVTTDRAPDVIYEFILKSAMDSINGSHPKEIVDALHNKLQMHLPHEPSWDWKIVQKKISTAILWLSKHAFRQMICLADHVQDGDLYLAAAFALSKVHLHDLCNWIDGNIHNVPVQRFFSKLCAVVNDYNKIIFVNLMVPTAAGDMVAKRSIVKNFTLSKITEYTDKPELLQMYKSYYKQQTSKEYSFSANDVDVDQADQNGADAEGIGGDASDVEN